MKHVKENDLAHGQWAKWCENDIGMKRQQADMFIKVAEEFEGQFDKTFCHLGLSALYQIALLPSDQREKPHTIPSTGEVKTVDEMTVREIELSEITRLFNEKIVYFGDLVVYISAEWMCIDERIVTFG